MAMMVAMMVAMKIAIDIMTILVSINNIKLIDLTVNGPLKIMMLPVLMIEQSAMVTVTIMKDRLGNSNKDMSNMI